MSGALPLERSLGRLGSNPSGCFVADPAPAARPLLQGPSNPERKPLPGQKQPLETAHYSWEQNCDWFIADFCIDLDR